MSDDPPAEDRPAPVRRMTDAIGRRIFGPLETARLPGTWRVLGWDVEQGLTLTLADRTRALLVEFEDADPARPCYGRTARFNLCVRHAFDAPAPLAPDEHALMASLLRWIANVERTLPPFEHAPTSRRSLVREIAVERALVPEGAGHYYFNPYVGCMIGCAFCYVAERADLSRRMEGLPDLPWGRYVDVKANAAEVLRRDVKKFPPGVVRMSPIVTDPYQPLERTYRITRQALEVFLEAGFTPVILTRGARVTEDLDLLSRFPVAAVGMSIPTDDDAVRAVFEPGADPVEERFAALEACHRAGVRTFCVVQPVLPMDPDHLVARVAPFVRAVRVDRMHFVDAHRDLYVRAGRPDAMEDGFFDRTESALRKGFAAHGITVDALDDLGRLVSR